MDQLEQHDDHCWLIANGIYWQIHRIDRPFIFMRRIYWDGLVDYAVIDTSEMVWDEYSTVAVHMIAEYWNEEGILDRTRPLW